MADLKRMLVLLEKVFPNILKKLLNITVVKESGFIEEQMKALTSCRGLCDVHRCVFIIIRQQDKHNRARSV